MVVRLSFPAENWSMIFRLMMQYAQVASVSKQDEIPRHWVDSCKLKILFPASGYASDLGLEESAKMIARLSDNWESKVSPSELEWGLNHLADLIASEMKDQLFLVIPSNVHRYYNRKKGFGTPTYEAFPSVRLDMVEAGNCIACGLNAAAGFHLMRVAEVGLWELGRDRKIPFAANEEIEFREWGRIIGQIEQAVKAISQWPNNPPKEDAHKFYNLLLAEIRGFNDGWRRHLAHVRKTQKPLNDDEALSLWGHVSRFMATMSEHIGEGRYMPEVWT